MKTLKGQSLITFIFFICILNAYALQTPGTAGAPFLKIGASARAESMGGMFAGMSDDVSAIEYNPGALAQIKENHVSLTHIIWFNDITLDTVLYGHKSGKSAFGLGGTILSAVDYARTKDDNTATDTSVLTQGEQIIQQNTLGVFSYSYAYEKTDVGFSLKYVGQQLNKSQSSAYAVDMGILFKSQDRRTGYGISLQNLGTALKADGTEGLPAAARFGIGRREDGFNVTLDLVQFIDSKIKYGGGMEIFFGKFLTMRAGGVFQNEFSFTGGLGFNFGSVKIDYAYLPHAAFGQAHRVTMLVGFGAPAPGRVQKVKAPLPVNRAAIFTKATLAVADIAGKNMSEADASIAADFLRTELVNAGIYRVLDRKNMELILAEQKFQIAGCTEQECAVKMGKLLNAKKVITGAYAKYGERRIVTANMVDVETGEITKSFGQEVLTADGLNEACKILALKLSVE